MRRLALAGRLVRACDPGDLDSPTLERAAAEARLVQRALTGFLTLAARRASELAEDGLGPGPEGLLTGHGEVSPAEVRADAARAEIANTMPAFGAALKHGLVGAGHLDAMSSAWRRATEEERLALRSVEGELAEAASGLSVESFNRRVNRTLERVRRELGSEPGERPSGLRLWMGRDNVGHLAGHLSGEDYERVVSALGSEVDSLVRHANESDEVADRVAQPVARDEQLTARALVERLERGRAGGSGRPSIAIVVGADMILGQAPDDGICETESGAPLSTDALHRCACDAVIRRVVVDDRGVATEVGRAYRTATPAQWAALRTMYTSCAWYGCDRPLGWCQAHHVVWWDEHGPTSLSNLVPLCSHHHHMAHEGGWGLTLTEDRFLVLQTPDGRPWRITRPDRLAPSGGSSPAPADDTTRGRRARRGRRPAQTDKGAQQQTSGEGTAA